MTAVQSGPTSITVTWTPPSPLDGITGYTISYTGGSSGSEAVSGGDTNSYTLTGLTIGQPYTISIVATTNGLSSAPVQATVGLGMSKFRRFSLHKNERAPCVYSRAKQSKSTTPKAVQNSYPSFPLCTVFVPATVPSAPVLDSTPTVTTTSVTVTPVVFPVAQW